MCALSSESIFLIQVSDFMGQISNVATQLVVPKSQSNINAVNFQYTTFLMLKKPQLVSTPTLLFNVAVQTTQASMLTSYNPPASRCGISATL